MTAKEAGLWEPIGNVGREDIRHMQSRVLQFHAAAAVGEADMVAVPHCAESFARWLVADSAAHASQPGAALVPAIPGAVLPLLPGHAEPETEE